MRVTIDDIEYAMNKAFKGRMKRKDVNFIRKNLTQIELIIYQMIHDGSWKDMLAYRDMVKINNNGKVRNIKSPCLATLILQHLAIYYIEDKYTQKDNNVGLNCKPGHGITAAQKEFSVIKRLKHLYYDCRNLNYGVIIDQRQCYMHIRPKHARKALKKFITDRDIIDFIIEVSFVNNRLPIGTPTSPPIHHVVMHGFDIWLKSACPYAVRYADDVFMAYNTIEEAQQMLWRVKQFWWYTYRIRSKSVTQQVFSLYEPKDFCGYVFHRNANKQITQHDKGYVTLRENTYQNAIHCKTNESYASYYGIMLQADMFNVMLSIEKNNMDLRRLTSIVRIERNLDAENIEIKELVDKKIKFTIFDYELRKGSDNTYNWIKCLIGIPERDEDGNLTGKILAREYHTGSESIVKFHVACERKYSKQSLLPISGVVIENRCGYIYKGSTNTLTYINTKNYE